MATAFYSNGAWPSCLTVVMSNGRDEDDDIDMATMECWLENEVFFESMAVISVEKLRIKKRSYQVKRPPTVLTRHRTAKRVATTKSGCDENLPPYKNARRCMSDE